MALWAAGVAAMGLNRGAKAGHFGAWRAAHNGTITTVPNMPMVLPLALTVLLGLAAAQPAMSAATAGGLLTSAPSGAPTNTSASTSASTSATTSATATTSAPTSTPTALPPGVQAADLQRLLAEAATTLWQMPGRPLRTEVQLGAMDPRLKLAPCQPVQAFLPPGTRPAGVTRVGLRCQQGKTQWSVTLPAVVKLWSPSLVARSTLPAGTMLEARHLAEAEVDLAASSDSAVMAAPQALGRTLVQALAAGQALRQADLKQRRWFNAGDTVRIVASGPGFAITTEGQALGPGVEGQPTRVRTEGGRIITGLPTAERRVDATL